MFEVSSLRKSGGIFPISRGKRCQVVCPRLLRRYAKRIFANVGKVLAAYERQIMPGRSRFDDYVAAAAAGDQERMAELFTAEEAAGLRLFIGEANCTDCHNGPLLTNGTFHNVGLPLDGTNLDTGRLEGVRQVVDDPFNCLGSFSDAVESDYGETRFAQTIEGETAILPPQTTNPNAEVHIQYSNRQEDSGQACSYICGLGHCLTAIDRSLCSTKAVNSLFLTIIRRCSSIHKRVFMY